MRRHVRFADDGRLCPAIFHLSLSDHTMNASRLAVLGLSICQLSVVAASAAPITLYDGSASPTAQGWTQRTSGDGTEVVGAGTTEFSTSGDNAYNTYSYATGATDFITSIRIRVPSALWDDGEPSAVFSPAADPVSGEEGGDSLSISRRPRSIASVFARWNDEPTSSVTVDDRPNFHELALRLQGDTLSFFIDATYDDIKNGTAVAVLSRIVSFEPGQVRGTIMFGDATTGRNLDSFYEVDFVKFEELTPATPVPEPASLTLLGLGLVGVAARIRKRKK
jgi:hypothetical protein